MSKRTARVGGGSTNRSREVIPLSMNDSSHGVGAVLSNSCYSTEEPMREANLKIGRARVVSHYDRAHDEATMHLGKEVMTLVNMVHTEYEGNEIVYSGRHSGRSEHESYRPKTGPTGATGRTMASKSSIFTTARSKMSLKSQPLDLNHGARNPSLHHLRASLLKDKPLTVTGHARAEGLSDHVAAGANQAEERLKQYRINNGITEVAEDTAHAMPKASTKFGCSLKTQWLDPDNNPIKPSKTLTSYREKIRTMNLPHISYDIDGDGTVGPEDMFMAKRFDIDGNGVLDEEEQHVGRQIIAEQFFAARAANEDLLLFGDEFQGKSMEQNIENLANAPGSQFKKKIQDLKNIERDLQTKGSKSMKDVLTCWNPEIIKHNYFTNKFDATAWNDFGAPGPRDPLFHLQDDHFGSLDTLKNLRKNKDRFYCQEKLDVARQKELKANPWMKNNFYSDKDKVSVAKTAFATNYRMENTSRRDEMASARSERGGKAVNREAMFSARKA